MIHYSENERNWVPIEDQSEVQVGSIVYYRPDHYKESGKVEMGRVKEIPEYTKESVRVVYHCAGQWEDYQKYTSALTKLSDLYFLKD